MTTAVESDATDYKDFADSVGRVLDRLWGDATAAPGADIAGLWDVAAEQGWFELGVDRALGFLVAAQRELGRRACPLPIADAYTAIQLLGGDEADTIARGVIRPLVCFTDQVDRIEFFSLECASSATHLVRVDTLNALVDLLPVEHRLATPGMAVPTWSRVSGSDSVCTRRLDVSEVRQIRSIAELALVVRTLAAAGCAHELATDHARTRTQFGRTIGAFGAVQQRIAHTQIELVSADLLVDEVIRHRDSLDIAMSADLAVHHGREVVTTALFAAQHTLGAIGYFEEHQASWLFRRVHADVAVLDRLRGRNSQVAGQLVEGGRQLPDAGVLGDSAFRSEIRKILHRWESGENFDEQGLRDEYARRGLYKLGWPDEFGGRSATAADRATLAAESKYFRAPVPVDRALSATSLLGHAILRHGTDEQKAEFLPLIGRGEMAFCLGYSEPEVGSDLASVRTRATREAGGWVIDGQKSWTTRALSATHVWLATRTDPEASPRHAGITIFLVPMDAPGIEIQSHTALSGEISCSVFYDRVRVPDSARVGDVNGGWRVITDALTSERLVMGGIAATLHRQFDDLVGLVRADPKSMLGSSDSYLRQRLSSLAARLQAARVMVAAANDEVADGSGKADTAPMVAVLAGELAEDLGQFAFEVLGPNAALSAGCAGSVGNGVFEQALRAAPMFVIGGGTNDIQRALIARRMGMARE
ncbi:MULTISPECIES: acyl-CoA dehydrogenase family protein [Rhodococcus]|uniref:acyl-CoA dehydrogenase family protein n=1 Tax=Rhodococcus globerulus TaxID=33008 RepID=UPI001C55BE5E|nr:acyl-CoA dehydrogenase family protein [Rhodococcus globerulus]QXV99938.1 acyl-CoA dehydrogenase family protein [Rhodococcus globerulus]